MTDAHEGDSKESGAAAEGEPCAEMMEAMMSRCAQRKAMCCGAREEADAEASDAVRERGTNPDPEESA